MTRRIFIVIGGGPSQAPFASAAKELDFEVVVIDLDPSCPGAVVANRFFPLSAREPAPIVAVSDDLAASGELAGVMTYSAHPGALRAAAAVAARHDLPCFSEEALEVCLDKRELKSRLVAHGVPTPASVHTADAGEALGLLDSAGEVIVKPAAESRGSVAVSLATDVASLTRAVAAAAACSSDGAALVEERCRGRELAVGGHVCEGEVTILAAAEKITGGARGGFVMTGFVAGGEAPSARVEEVARDVVAALGIDDSFFTVDLIVTDRGPVVLEAGVLLDAKIDRLLLHGGVDPYRYFCRRAARLPTPPPILESALSLRFLFAESAGGLRILSPSVEGGIVEWERHDGDAVRPPESIADTVGWVITKGENRQLAVAAGRGIAETGELFTVENKETP
jgi:phosphoribosylaminoimidazole carboxylase (NCAIR synthetase)